MNTEPRQIEAASLLRFDRPWQRVVLQEYFDATKVASARVVQLSDHLIRALPEWSLAPMADSLIALRGIDKLAVIVLLAELGDISRFDSPPGPDGLSRAGSERTHLRRPPAPRGITLSGNGHARRMMLVESAETISWAAQKRLCGRYRTLTRGGKNTRVVCVIIARELAGFILDIVRHEMAHRTPKAV